MQSFKSGQKKNVKIIYTMAGLVLIIIPIVLIILVQIFSTFLIFIPFIIEIIGVYVLSLGWLQFTVQDKQISYRGPFFIKKEFKIKDIKRIEIGTKKNTVATDESLENVDYIIAYDINKKALFSMSTAFHSLENGDKLLRVLRSGGAKVHKEKQDKKKK